MPGAHVRKGKCEFKSGCEMTRSKNGKSDIYTNLEGTKE
jgi:hypothetical protein